MFRCLLILFEISGNEVPVDDQVKMSAAYQL